MLGDIKLGEVAKLGFIGDGSVKETLQKTQGSIRLLGRTGGCHCIEADAEEEV